MITSIKSISNYSINTKIKTIKIIHLQEKTWRFSFCQFVVLEWSPLKVDLLTTESTPTFNADVSILLLRALLLRLLLMCQKNPNKHLKAASLIGYY